MAELFKKAMTRSTTTTISLPKDIIKYCKDNNISISMSCAAFLKEKIAQEKRVEAAYNSGKVIQLADGTYKSKEKPSFLGDVCGEKGDILDGQTPPN